VPIPPSKKKGDQDYDDRMLQMLEHLKTLINEKHEYEIDIRELVIQTENTPASHNPQNDQRLSPDDLIKIYEVDQNVLNGTNNTILICDDVLTTGAHYKAMQIVLSEHIPNRKCAGIFLARCVHTYTFDVISDENDS